MAKAKGLEAEIPFSICGIPCLIGVESYFYQAPFAGSAWNCDSDIDYYGDEEATWVILDRKGYIAGWLENKVDSNIEENIEETIRNYFSD
jgi:hypothetical protein